ncbi:hypothetical protein [Mycobacterium sp. GA-1199]|uniref:hypothetical protein n=1 Tax=Mycobacterium sp. GA-1199 TaxID=1772287 RepID=UPI000AFD7405
MTVSADEGRDSAVKKAGVHYDPYDADPNRDPHPMFSRIREQAPLYSNAEHDFYAPSRYADPQRPPSATRSHDWKDASRSTRSFNDCRTGTSTSPMPSSARRPRAWMALDACRGGLTDERYA